MVNNTNHYRSLLMFLLQPAWRNTFVLVIFWDTKENLNILKTSFSTVPIAVVLSTNTRWILWFTSTNTEGRGSFLALIVALESTRWRISSSFVLCEAKGMLAVYSFSTNLRSSKFSIEASFSKVLGMAFYLVCSYINEYCLQYLFNFLYRNSIRIRFSLLFSSYVTWRKKT